MPSISDASVPTLSPSSSSSSKPGKPLPLQIICRSCNLDLSESHYTPRQVRKRKQLLKDSLALLQINLESIICLACTNTENETSQTETLVKLLLPSPPNSFCYVTMPPRNHISGIGYYRDFLTPEEAKRVLSIVDGNEWRKEIRRRQQFYGEVYYHTTIPNGNLQPGNGNVNGNVNGNGNEDNSGKVLDVNEFAFLKDKIMSFDQSTGEFNGSDDKDKIFQSSPFPSQILVNEYIENAGIASHFEDFDAFGPIIATISLISPILMTLKNPIVKDNDCEDLHDRTKILLEPNSLFVMKGEVRDEWRHGISRTAKYVPVVGGGVVVRDEVYRRVSLTIRHLKETRRRVEN